MEITATEKEQGKLSEKNLDLACQKLSEIGYVIFENLLPLEFVEKVRKEFENNECTREWLTNNEITFKKEETGVVAEFTEGFTNLIAADKPEINPPPPTGIIATSISGIARIISYPQVAAPSII